MPQEPLPVMQNQAIATIVNRDQEEWGKESAIIYNQCAKFMSTQVATPINNESYKVNRKLQKSICDLDFDQDISNLMRFKDTSKQAYGMTEHEQKRKKHAVSTITVREKSI